MQSQCTNECLTLFNIVARILWRMKAEKRFDFFTSSKHTWEIFVVLHRIWITDYASHKIIPVTYRRFNELFRLHLDSRKKKDWDIWIRIKNFLFLLSFINPFQTVNSRIRCAMIIHFSLLFSHLNQQMEFDLNKVIFQTHFSSHKFPRTLIIYTSSPSNSSAQRSCFPFADLIYWQDWRRRRANFAPKGCLQLSSRLHLVFIIHRNLVECLHAQGSHVSCYMWENL